MSTTRGVHAGGGPVSTLKNTPPGVGGRRCRSRGSSTPPSLWSTRSGRGSSACARSRTGWVPVPRPCTAASAARTKFSPTSPIGSSVRWPPLPGHGEQRRPGTPRSSPEPSHCSRCCGPTRRQSCCSWDTSPLGRTRSSREHALQALLTAGLSPRVAAQTYTAVARYVIGFGLQLGEEAPTSPASDDDLSALYRSLDPQHFPATVSAADSLPRPLADEFHFGLNLILRGVRQIQGEA
jgi:hypothetical protein